MKKLILILTLLIAFNSFGAKVVKEGQVVPYDGVLFDMEEEKELRQTREDKIKLEQLSVLYKQKIDIQKERIDNFQDYIKKTKPLTGWEKAIYFGLGVLVTGGTLYISSQLIKNIK